MPGASIIPLLLVLTACVVRGADESPFDERLRQAVAGRQADAVAAIAEQLDAAWGTGEREAYVPRMLAVIRAVQENEFADRDRRYEVLAQATQLLLAKDPTVTLGDQISAIRLLFADGEYATSLSGEAWNAYRARTATLALRVAAHIERRIDHAFDPADGPMLNVTPPEGTGLPPGAAASAIADPAVRSAYERDLATNAEKAKRYAEQQHLSQLAGDAVPMIVGKVAALYREHPDPAGIEAALTAAEAPATLRAQLARDMLRR